MSVYPLEEVEQAITADMTTKSMVLLELLGPKIWQIFASHCGCSCALFLGFHNLRMRVKVAKDNNVLRGSLRFLKILVPSRWNATIKSFGMSWIRSALLRRPCITSYSGLSLAAQGFCATSLSNLFKKPGTRAGTEMFSGNGFESMETHMLRSYQVSPTVVFDTLITVNLPPRFHYEWRDEARDSERLDYVQAERPVHSRYNLYYH